MNRDCLGRIQIYTGAGRGKSSSALGLALRMLGAGGSVWLFAFMKDHSAAEYQVLDRLAPAFNYRCANDIKQPWFDWQDQEQQRQTCRCYLNVWQEMMALLSRNPPHLLIVDEISYLLSYKIIEREQVLGLLDFCRLNQVELILTGRDMPDFLLAVADLVSEIQMVKHPLQQGIGARVGIDC